MASGAAIGSTIVFGTALDDFDTFGNFAQNKCGDESSRAATALRLNDHRGDHLRPRCSVLTRILATTHRNFTPRTDAAGFTLALIHMVPIPIDNTSVNPDWPLWRTIFSDSSTLGWAFIVSPDRHVGVFIWLMIDDTLKCTTPRWRRHMATNAINNVVEEIDDVTNSKD